MGGATAGLIVSQESFDSLPADLKKILLDLQPQFAQKLYENMVSLAEKSRKGLVGKGMEVNTWPEADMKKKIEIGSAIWKKWYEKANSGARKVFDLTNKTVKEEGLGK